MLPAAEQAGDAALLMSVRNRGSETIAKAIDHPIPPGYRVSEKGPKPVIEPFRHIIDAWLDEGPKQRPAL